MRSKSWVYVSLFMILISIYGITCYAQWNRISGFVGGPVNTLTAFGSNIFAGTKYGGIFISTDGGESWKQSSINESCVNCIASHGSNIVAGLWGGGIYFSPDDGLTWKQSQNPGSVWSIASRDSIFYCLCGSDLCISSDGQNWEKKSLNIKDVSAVTLSKSYFLAGTFRKGKYRYFDYGIYKSTNEGLVWDEIFSTNLPITLITIYRNNIYAATYKNTIYLSTDNGNEWAKIDFKQENIYSLAAMGSYVFAGTDSGIYISYDKGFTWKQSSLKNETVRSIIINEKKVYCGTDKDGVFFSNDNGKTWNKTSLIDFQIIPVTFDQAQLQVGWTDFKHEPGVLYFGGNIVNINFTVDSFYYSDIRFTDDFDPKDTCNKYHGYEYAVGNYKLENDSIYFSGNWTDKSYKNILTYGCFNIGKFELVYKYKYYSNGVLALELINPSSLPINSTGMKEKLFLFKK